VILTGYQVAGTRGRALADGTPQIKIHGRYVPVRAEVVNVQGFSAHADGEQLVSWVSGAGEPRAVFVVHGEPASAEALAQRVRDRCSWTAVVARHGEKVRID
jgi:metallo-beta-lactamase family protein